MTVCAGVISVSLDIVPVPVVGDHQYQRPEGAARAARVHDGKHVLVKMVHTPADILLIPFCMLDDVKTGPVQL